MMTTDKNLEFILQSVSKHLSIDEHRKSYAVKYNTVRNTIYSRLQKIDQLFDKLSNGHLLAGSVIFLAWDFKD